MHPTGGHQARRAFEIVLTTAVHEHPWSDDRINLMTGQLNFKELSIEISDAGPIRGW
jgi:hypothetical protein